MNKAKIAQILFLIFSISGLFLAISTFIPFLNILVPMLVTIFAISSLLLPWAKNANIWISRIGFLGIAFYFTGHIFPELSVLLLIGIIMAVVIAVLNVFIGNSANDKSENEIPLPGPSQKQGKTVSYIKYFVSSNAAILNPFQLLQMIFQIIGMIIAGFRQKKAKPATEYIQQAEYWLPVLGKWVVYNGGTTQEDSHSWGVLNQRYAYDMVIMDSNKVRHKSNGRKLEDYYCYGEPVVAPADGTVIQVKNNVQNAKYSGTMIIDFLAKDFRGNFITIKHAQNEYSFMAHFIPNSIIVKVGEKVKQGQLIGRCGNSGHSSEPHLHFHIQDHPNFYLGVGLPVQFNQLEINGKPYEKAYIKKGEEIQSITTKVKEVSDIEF